MPFIQTGENNNFCNQIITVFRFYEIDNWYKARIERPELFPNLHIIDPDLYVSTFEEKFVKRNFLFVLISGLE